MNQKFLPALLVAFFLLLLQSTTAFSQKGKDGSDDLSPGVSTTYILNRYSALTASAAAGATSVTVNNITELSGATAFTNSYNAFSTAALSVGDLVMIMQVQGATITTTDDINYGAVSAYNGAGNFEMKTVLSISGNVITFCEGLSYAYGVGGTKRSQVVRVPRMYNLTVGSFGVVSAFPWNGTTGGVCAIEANGSVTINGSVNVTGTGFRGGTEPDDKVSSTPGAGIVTLYRTTATGTAAGKGEGIAGNVTDYASLNGANGRGGPANGGGGGNGYKSGGGGGSNAGNSSSLTPWNGTGIKSTSTAAWANAWNLEAGSFASDISRGGGRGGYTHSSVNADALTLAPGNSGWGGDYRDNVGGRGGRPLDYGSNTRLFLGGGGGAGEAKDNQNGDGGNGGGIVWLSVGGYINGTGGTILANGADGESTKPSGKDGAGGAGGGGAIIVLCNYTINNIALQAKGGSGGNQLYTSNEAAGPGGGGGGGYIGTTTLASGSRVVTGGANGICTSSALTEFTPNGATGGDAGTRVTLQYAEVNDCYAQINGIATVSCTLSAYTVPAANTIINTYYPSTSTISQRSIKIPVGTKRSGGATTDIQAGDLLLFVQMQGATINTTNTNSYGDGVNTGDASGHLTAVAGTYEYVYAATAVIGGYIYLTTPLKNSYTHTDYTAGVAGQYRYQVIRVPQYSSLTIGASRSITTVEWNGSTGGVVAANVSGAMTLSGGTVIDVSGLGFRGGGGRQLTGATGGSTSDYVTLATTARNGSKGEGIAGTPQYVRSIANVLVNLGTEGYPNGSYASGAPGNAGGGATDGSTSANNQNTGGGGGGNGGKGGRGGFGNVANVPPGGFGGAPVGFGVSSKLVLGGGGGAGSSNDGTGSPAAGFASSGATGGGMIFLKVGSISGTGTLAANGANGLDVLQDGAGGGGAGGSVYLYSVATAGLANITVNAKGGNGGNTLRTTTVGYGPGGGGGGGIVYTNAAINAASSVTGGTAGLTTNTANNAFGAVAGNAGAKYTTATNLITVVKVYCDIDDDNDGVADVAEWPYGFDPFLDSDNDGIPNAYDVIYYYGYAIYKDDNGDFINDYFDWDQDGILNQLDLDSDNDGIPDVIESYGVDQNGDGIIDNYTDTNGNGLSDNAETNGSLGLGAGDFDGIGYDNLQDSDTDNDGIPDVIEAGGADTDNDGLIDNYNIDNDEDGFADAVDGDVGNDGVAENSVNALIRSGADTNGDGKADSWPYKNVDNEGLPNCYDLDSDGDGITDLVEAGLPGSNGIADGDLVATGWSEDINAWPSLDLPNTDGVGLANLYDLDSDDDGISDNVEAQSTYVFSNDVSDSDGDGISDDYDDNSAYGATGLIPYDYDGDGLPNYIEKDSDNDGIPDVVEAYGVDANGDGMIDNFTDPDLDGLSQNVDSSSVTGTGSGSGLGYLDTDKDRIANYIDRDSDNDGIPDVLEASAADANNDGIIDGFADTNGNGWIDSYELTTALIKTGADTNSDGRPDSYPNKNTDQLGYPNAYDIDSDGDGITDAIEAGFATSNGLATGTLGADGWSDTIDALATITFPNTDGNGPVNYLDLDSDNDGISDQIEGQLNYVAPTTTDTDKDGLADVYDPTPLAFGGGNTPANQDADALASFIDLDSDNDGVPDVVEAYGVETNGDGLIDNFTDTDADGLSQNVDANDVAYLNSGVGLGFVDLDGDGIANNIDLDSDNDGIPDIIEATAPDSNNDGRIDSYTDTDNNGWHNAYEAGGALLNTGTDGNGDGKADSYPNKNTDGLGYANPYDLDSDGDGIPDVAEANFASTNGIVNGTKGSDGWSDTIDALSALNLPNSDATGGLDYVDLDSDNDGIADNAEWQLSASYIAPTTIDADNDGLADVYDASLGTFGGGKTPHNADADGLPNHRDKDSDNDGVPDVVEAYGVDVNGDGIIDNFTDTDNDGLSQNVDVNTTGFASSGVGLGYVDRDGDAIPNYVDLDSDGDGIPDILEAGGTDTNNDGKADASTDTNTNGWIDSYETGLAMVTGTDTNSDGRTDSWPSKNADQTSYSNLYDLDSDGDGLSDMAEAGLTGTNSIVSGTIGADGWSDTVDGLGSFTLPNTDGRGPANYLDIDSDDDGIPDNVEGQPTYSYSQPTDVDSDNDGIVDAYDILSTYGAGSITPYDHDSDGTPDYKDSDTDNDGAPDINEASRIFTLTQANINTTDSDGDGLVNQFDNVTLSSQAVGSKYFNNTNSNMGTGGTFNGPYPSGSNVQLVKSQLSGGDRDWRNTSVLPLQIVSFTGNLQNNTAHLEWKTENELQVEDYEVQRSSDATVFTGIAKVTALNHGLTASYTYSDDLSTWTGKKVYYRIRQLNKSGEYYYTRVVNFTLDKKDQDNITAYPNPVKDVLTINISSLIKDNAQVQVLDALGKVVMSKSYPIEKGQNTLSLTSFGPLPKGLYMLQIQTAASISSKKIMKQ